MKKKLIFEILDKILDNLNVKKNENIYLSIDVLTTFHLISKEKIDSKILSEKLYNF